MTEPTPIDIDIQLDELVDMIIHQAINEAVRFFGTRPNDTEIALLHEVIVTTVVEAIEADPDILRRAVSVA